jgi:hypothetical protein
MTDMDHDLAERLRTPRRRQEPPKWTPPDNERDVELAPALLLEQWLDRDLPSADYLLGEWLSTTSRVMLVGTTGLGKTMFLLAVALAIASNKSLLHWAASGKSRRVLYVDGEMPRRLMKSRLADAVVQGDADPSAELLILNREDHPDMPPLNTAAGQDWLCAFIERHGPFDLIVFDNIQALLVGNMKDEEQWAEVLPFARWLTRKRIGQVWVHQTGHDETRSYGSKAREWQLCTVGVIERVEDAASDLAFSLKFTKARERTPDNRANFEPVTMQLVDDKWTWSQGVDTKKTRGPGPDAMLADRALTKALANEGKTPQVCRDIPSGTPCVTEDYWKLVAFNMGFHRDAETKRRNQAFNRAAGALQERSMIGRWGGLVWRA